MPEFNVPIEVVFEFNLTCAKCGRDIGYEEKISVGGDHLYKIEPCPICEDLTKEINYAAGHTAGHYVGYTVGYDEGYTAGYDAGREDAEAT